MQTYFDQELGQISDWFLANKLSLNVEKNKIHVISLTYVNLDQENIPSKLPPLQLNDNIIERENSLKFLGVILDEHLTFINIQLTENNGSKNVRSIKPVN